jgi:hypothetical protein
MTHFPVGKRRVDTPMDEQSELCVLKLFPSLKILRRRLISGARSRESRRGNETYKQEGARHGGLKVAEVRTLGYTTATVRSSTICYFLRVGGRVWGPASGAVALIAEFIDRHPIEEQPPS